MAKREAADKRSAALAGLRVAEAAGAIPGVAERPIQVLGATRDPDHQVEPEASGGRHRTRVWVAIRVEASEELGETAGTQAWVELVDQAASLMLVAGFHRPAAFSR